VFDNAEFQKLVEADNLTGEVIASNSFIIEVRGLEGVRIGASVLFEDGQRGLVREAYGDLVILFNIDTESIKLGTLAVVAEEELQVPVGTKLIGRVLSPMGEPLDDKGAVRTTASSGVFNPAPGFMERSKLDEQLTSGVSAVDMFFPIVLGQRIAVLGDSKSGKSTLLSQLSASQDGTDRVVVYVMIGKRKVDIEQLLAGLEESGAMEHTIVIKADIFDSLTQSYLAPYAACAMAEHLWKQDRDVIIIYDDLTSHAEAYRQLSLLQEVDPGRDSFPGDMFYAHSSLLERAGKLSKNNKTLTALPVVTTPNNEITSYLSTNIMSITDGQLVLDLKLFREGIRPALNAGLSVSRVGGQAQTVRQKQLSGELFKRLARYNQAEEFSHFGSSLSQDAKVDFTLGKQIYAALLQPPQEILTITEQQLLMETVMLGGGKVELDVARVKEAVRDIAPKIKDEKDLDKAEVKLLKQYSTAPVQTLDDESAEAAGATDQQSVDTSKSDDEDTPDKTEDKHKKTKKKAKNK